MLVHLLNMTTEIKLINVRLITQFTSKLILFCQLEGTCSHGHMRYKHVLISESYVTHLALILLVSFKELNIHVIKLVNIFFVPPHTINSLKCFPTPITLNFLLLYVMNQRMLLQLYLMSITFSAKRTNKF